MENIFLSQLGSSEEQYGRSDGYLDSTGHASEEADRSASESLPLEFWTDLSPQSVAMELNPSEGASSDQSYTLLPTDLDFTTQMSNGFGHQDMFQPNYVLGTTQSFQSSDGSFGQSLNPPAVSFDHNSQPGFSHQIGHLARNHTEALSNTEGFQDQWLNTGRYGGPTLKFEPPEDDMISPSTLPHQASQPSWPLEDPTRYAGQALPHHVGWGPANNTLNSLNPSYAGSVLSHDSSPPMDGLATPESAKSPMLSTANPNSSSVSSNGGDSTRRAHYQDIQQTPRPFQTGFQPASMNHQHGMGGVTSLRTLMIDANVGQQVHREPTHSPSSDYIMVELNDALSTTYSDDRRTSQPQLKEKKPSQRGSKKLPSSKVRHEPDPFVPEFPMTTGSIRRQSGDKKSRDGKRVGGRTVGMHLKTDVAARAKQLRDEGSCWICCFQRDSCSPGPVCGRCQKRHQRAQMEHGLGCDRTKLNDLRPYFIPDFLARSGDQRILNEFMKNHIRRWDNKPLRLRVNIIWGQSPMELELYEFEPKTAELVRHLQSVLDEKTGKRNWVNKGSPPLAMVSIEHEDRNSYERFIDDIVDHPKKLEKFVDRCYKYEKDDFQSRLFRLMFDYQPAGNDEKPLRREIMRLLVITYIYSRATTIVNGDLHLLSTLRYAAANRITYSKATTVRLANRQLKYLYTSLWIQIMESVLKKLQLILRSSRGGAKWSSAFVAVLGLGMAFETIQMASHTHQEAERIMGNATDWEARDNAEKACRVVDEKFFFLATLFRWKYHRGFNPFKNINDRKVHEDLGPNALEFVRGVYGLVQEKSEYLQFREQMPILQENKEKYTSRLVAKFLLAFWKPSA